VSSPIDGLCQALGLGPAAAPILEALSALYREIDAEVAARASGHDLPCRAGCDACCHESVFLSAPEFLAVAAELFDRRSAENRRTLVAQMCALAERYQDELEQLELFGPGAERDEVAARIKFSCPLLLGDGRCSVYAARELNARTFGQSWDPQRGEPYGCELTVGRLAVLQPRPALFDAREARRRLVSRLPGTERVFPFPWWFSRYREALSGSG
jgi:hypothetical protein